MKREEFGGEGARYVIVAAIVVAVAWIAWSGIKKAGEYESLAAAHKCAVILNNTLIFPVYAKAPDAPFSEQAYALRDWLFARGIREDRPVERSCAWLAVYFPEYMMKGCAGRLDVAAPLNNEACTGRIHCGDEVLDVAMGHLVSLSGQPSLPDDFVELYYVGATSFCAGFGARSRAYEGMVRREHFEALYSLYEPAFAGVLSVSGRAGAYRSLLRAVQCLYEIESGGGDAQAAVKAFRGAVDGAERQGRFTGDKILQRILKNLKELPVYKGALPQAGPQ